MSDAGEGSVYTVEYAYHMCGELNGSCTCKKQSVDPCPSIIEHLRKCFSVGVRDPLKLERDRMEHARKYEE